MEKWAQFHNVVDVLPISPLQCAVYLFSVVQTAFYSLRHAHCNVGVVSPTESTLVRNVLEAAKRRLAKPVVKKDPITIHILESTRMYDSKIESGSLYDLRIVTMCLLAYAGFLRSAELLHICRSDILFYVSHIAVCVY